MRTELGWDFDQSDRWIMNRERSAALVVSQQLWARDYLILKWIQGLLDYVIPLSWLTFRHTLQTSPQHTGNSLSYAAGYAVFKALRNIRSTLVWWCKKWTPPLQTNNLRIPGYMIWKQSSSIKVNSHSLLLLQLPRLPLTIRRMVSRDDGDWVSVARATGLSTDGGSGFPFLGRKWWRQELKSVGFRSSLPTMTQWAPTHSECLA